MNGAELVISTALAAGIEICFANVGTTEIPLVTALDTIPGIRAVLGLHEAVCTGAADGYGRMLGRPAMTILHLGPGLANGISNLHNARRAHTPILNLTGEHASWHRSADPPLKMDIEALAGTVAGWMRTCESVADLSRDTAEAVAAAMQGQIAGLILPHDCQWSDCTDETIRTPAFSYGPLDHGAIEAAARLLRTNSKSLILLGGGSLLRRGMHAAARIRAVTGCDLLSETFPAHMERGMAIPSVDRLPYFPEHAAAVLSQYQAVVLAGTNEPVAFFGYKDMTSRLLTEEQQTCSIAGPGENVSDALEYLADAVGASSTMVDLASTAKPLHQGLPAGKLTREKAAMILAALQPENAIVVDESITAGMAYYPLTATAEPHSLLTLTGGSLGMGMPCAVGAALACPDRQVISFQADGSAMYTLQALWTQAREGLNITTLICSNRSYDILKLELMRAGNVPVGQNALALTDLKNPSIDWVKICHGMGVPAVSVDTAEQLAKELIAGLREAGPHLIEMVLA
ncbi:MAG: acetolactate synthase large subunit [Desulfomonilaceae bacterium]